MTSHLKSDAEPTAEMSGVDLSGLSNSTVPQKLGNAQQYTDKHIIIQPLLETFRRQQNVMSRPFSVRGTKSC
jgi:hypothetical protein